MQRVLTTLLLGFTAVVSDLGCGNGSYTASSGLCTVCVAGAYCRSSDANYTSNLCPFGTYNALANQSTVSACLPCADGVFSSPGAGTCCPVSHWSAAGTTSCTPCSIGRFSTVQGANSPASCSACPLVSSPLEPGDLQLCTLPTSHSSISIAHNRVHTTQIRDKPPAFHALRAPIMTFLGPQV